MTTIQKGLYSIVGFAATTSAALAVTNPNAFGQNKINIGATSDQSIETSIQVLIDRAMMFLALLAVIYGIWGGFQILTAGGDEEKVKKGRTIIIQVVIGIIVIVLAGSVVKWVINLVAGV
ncbi:hypothetical protein H7169_01215 [Candidatus Gracilibacteria bacterium]|nr:hypothetical protein [Candidatus Gracilibacteria bacterium]